MKGGFWKTDWFLGVVVTLVILFAGSSDLVKGLERKAYDMGVLASSRNPSDKIAIIAIDKQSIDNIGRWPWSREIHAKMADDLAKAGAKVIGNAVFFSESQVDPGLVYVNKMLDLFPKPPAAAGTDAPAPPPAPPLTPEQQKFFDILHEAEQTLNVDRKLAESYAKAGNVVLPMLFQLGEPLGKPDKPLPDYVKKNAIPAANIEGKDSGDNPLLTTALEVSVVDSIGGSVAAIGHLNARQDVDGAIRTEPLVLTNFDEFYPSFALMVAAKSLNLGVNDIKIKLGDSLRLGNLKIRTSPESEMYTFYYKDRDGRPAFSVDSFFDVKTGKIPLEKYKDKIVLIGPTAPGVGNIFTTPIGPGMASVLLEAHTVSSILQENFFVAPTWSGYASFAMFLLVAAYLIAFLPRLKAGMGAGITAGILAVLLIAHFTLMSTQGIWLQFMWAATLLVIGHVLLITKRFVMTEAGKLKSDADSAESNRMLGLAYQGQGQLDMAYDKFRKVPLDDTVMDNLFNLALDFERKRQFNKAEAVFRYMYDFNPKFRDVEQRLGRAKSMGETVMLGGSSGGRTNTSLLDVASVEKPMLGRYQVEKELGKGAMGVVYLGRDPKINRVVAIKTMALAQEFDADELEDVKARFFREAETAGRLNHPNIVTIFDAGEEHDLAYISMEFLKGKDLVAQTKADALMPIDKVMSIIARVADALSYAHSQNVVHRDIKPANIMYDAESDTVKVTDFGIARITDSSKTKTGMVLGTPSYMSPEQLSGTKIDGRSDLFSLGVSLYQMACGKLPFVGDSMAQLMFKIANEQQEDIRAVNPALPACLSDILNRALAKNIEERYQNGAEMAQALKACMGSKTEGGGVDVDFSL
jgi:CHASE2 domain-containing sensor protein